MALVALFWKFPLVSQHRPLSHFGHQKIIYNDEDDDDGPQPDQNLEQGMALPNRLAAIFPDELVGTPLEDIDSFYQNQKVGHLYCFNLVSRRRKFV